MKTKLNSFDDIAIGELKPGMYVVSISTDNDKLSVKSEGYILNDEGVNKLVRSGIKRVCVDPAKEKKTERIDKVLPELSSEALLKEKSQEKPKTSLDQEMNQASKLYKNAKALQHKMLAAITEGKVIDVEGVQESTNAMVDSIFRNQDALSCMSRLRIKDEYLVEHSLNVCILMTIFAKHLGFDKPTIEQLSLGAFLHDIGKVLVPDEILNKPGKFSRVEYEVMQEHVQLGLRVLEETPEISDIAISMVAEHHERIDGTGYPHELLGYEISEYGLMIAIVDSYDAMTAERVYKSAMHPITAFKHLIKESPDYYDKALVEQFIQCLGVYPVGTLVRLSSGKIGLISKLNKSKPLNPCVRVFYNARLKQTVAMEEIDLSLSKYQDQIDRCIKPEEFSLNLVGFFKASFID
ncbi:HD-GYP domain-containing protein [Shewanella violacea]|uniref:HD domain protein n=1 Tax=Shewanella violacea (strain JCM 10179 / CIP 106290 / LMG 19151 / DSS12) TaxID=637905 RepID=D4ZLA4_SHEVD|nr:HD-GYP domain-containing protein [Shewanella violacea]BAJ02453.1 HD domain protein [Shewanella violacea DSS12]